MKRWWNNYVENMNRGKDSAIMLTVLVLAAGLVGYILLCASYAPWLFFGTLILVVVGLLGALIYYAGQP